MKKFILAAAAVLSLGVGSAFAQPLTFSNHPVVTHWGPSYGTDGGAVGGN